MPASPPLPPSPLSPSFTEPGSQQASLSALASEAFGSNRPDALIVQRLFAYFRSRSIELCVNNATATNIDDAMSLRDDDKPPSVTKGEIDDAADPEASLFI